MGTLSDIDKMRPFLLKHCKEGGAFPSVNCVRQVHRPKLFALHFAALKIKLANQTVSIITDETTDCRDHSILNVIASIRGELFLIDVVTLGECNYRTLSQAYIRAVTHVDIVGEVFSHWSAFDNVTQLITFIKSTFFKKASRKKRYLKWLEGSLPKEHVKLPPVPVATRWNSWFNAARYPSSIVQFYEGFFKQEKSHGLAVHRILELVDDCRLHHASCHNLRLNLHFIKEKLHPFHNSFDKLRRNQVSTCMCCL